MTSPIATPADRSRPLDASLRVRDALDVYLAENGFRIAEYDARWTPASLFGIPFAVPNTAAHRRGIMRHDLHHVATGFGTDLAGEGEISAWEVGGGLRSTGADVASLVLLGAVTGYLLAPRRAREAGRRSGKRNLFAADEARYAELLEMTLGELRESLGLPREGIASGPRGLHARAPAQGMPASGR